MSVHYKFKSALEYDTITFDGLHISVKDLKNAIIQQKRIGKSTDFDLQVTNAQTKEVYSDENVLIPKNTSLLIARIPNTNQTKSKQWEGYGGDSSPTVKLDDGGPIAKAADLSSLDAPEDDKIKAMMSQSTQDYDPSNYQKIRGANQMGAVPPTYRCYKCHQTGHWIKDCTFSLGGEAIEIKKSTGIPQSFMVPVEGPQVPGAMMTPNGSYAVPALDHEAYNSKPAPAQSIPEPKPDIPEDLVCSICSDLLTDAVMIPCCGNSFCDECIRFTLLESEDHECPDCHEKDISPGTLIPNRFLRKSVANFKNTTGYVKKPIFRPPPREMPNKNLCSDNAAEKPVISEADSTEQSKMQSSEKNGDEHDALKSVDFSESEVIKDGPPGVSPKQSPQGSQIKRLDSINRIDVNRLKSHKEETRSPHLYERDHNNEERPGTPTVDEPGGGGSGGANNYQYNSTSVSSGLSNVISISNCPPPNLGSSYPAGQPPIGNFPPSGPPPNFRLPPPGGVPPYMQPGPYTNPPRPMFDPTRPPMAGPPPSFNPNYPARPSSHHHHHRSEYDRRIRNRTPPGIIDDPLAAFNRMIREKDERERRAKQRMQRRSSYSRSRSRSYSPRSPRRMRSRSPRRRSRSRSFSLSRSRSRSYSGSLRGGSPSYRDRDYSPRHSPRRGPPPSRYRSPVRSPPRRYKDSHVPDRRDRDRDDYERDYRRDDRDYPYAREHSSKRERDIDRNDREYRNYDGGNYEDRYGGRPSTKGQWGSNSSHPMRGPHEAYFNPPPPEIAPNAYQTPSNRYPTTREYPPPYMNKPEMMYPVPPQPVQRKYEDIAPPGVEEPPVPGLENSPSRNEKYESIRNPSEPRVEVREKDEKQHPKPPTKETEKVVKNDKEKDRERYKNERESRRDKERKERESERKKRSTPTRKRSRSNDEKRKKKRDDSSDKERKDYSDDEKSKKTKDRKKKKEKDKKDKDKKKRDKKEKHKEKRHKDEAKDTEVKKNENDDELTIATSTHLLKTEDSTVNLSKKQENQEIQEVNTNLYDDEIPENVENERQSNENLAEDEKEEIGTKQEFMKSEENELDHQSNDDERDILELHSNDIDLKNELETKNEMLAPLPEKSKWEDDDENGGQLSPKDSKGGSSGEKNSKSGSVSTEVLKRAENAIFAKAINAIRPIEIKKLSADRAKLYSGEKEEEKLVIQPIIIEKKVEKIEKTAPPTKLSVKERLGAKVNEPDLIIRTERTSPFSRRISERNYARNFDREEKSKRDERNLRNKDRELRKEKDARKEIKTRDYRKEKDTTSHHHHYHRREERDKDRRRSRSKPKGVSEIEKRKRSRSRSRSQHKDKKQRKDKKHSKEKERKKKDEKEEKEKDEKPPSQAPSSSSVVLKLATDKRKPTLDEANFEPDYDIESEHEDKEKKKEQASSSDSDSSSSSDDEKKKKKRRKHKKKKSKKDSSSSSSDSESDSSDDDKEKKRKKHKKNKKKKKKSKHK